jgi:ribose transport system permease protein
MIATVSTLFVGRGIIYVWTGGTADSLSHADHVFWLTQLFGGSWLAMKNGFFIFILVVALAQTLLSAARFGNHLPATGGDVDTAHSRGISVARVKTSAFILSATLATSRGS